MGHFNGLATEVSHRDLTCWTAGIDNTIGNSHTVLIDNLVDLLRPSVKQVTLPILIRPHLTNVTGQIQVYDIQTYVLGPAKVGGGPPAEGFASQCSCSPCQL